MSSLTNTRSSTSPRKRPGGRSARIRAAVLDATLRVLVQHGYAGLRLDDVAAEAGVHKTTVYRRWGSREALVIDATLHFSEQHIPVPDTGNVRDDLMALTAEFVGAAESGWGRAIMNALLAAAATEPGMADLSHEVWDRRLSIVKEVVVRGKARGELPSDVTPHDVLELIFGPVYGRLFIWNLPVSKRDIHRIVDTTLAGLNAVASTARRSRSAAAPRRLRKLRAKRKI
jgi:AcrR family transcriptional regulator